MANFTSKVHVLSQDLSPNKIKHRASRICGKIDFYAVGPGLISNHNFRYISIDDRSHHDRSQFLGQLLPVEDRFAFGENNTYALSTDPYFNVLILGGDDTVRITKYIRANAKLLAGRLIIVLTSRSNPTKRARLLNAGCDDVFDIDRMEIAEAAARLTAHIARHEIYRQSFREEQIQLGKLNEIVKINRCSSRELELIRIFVSHSASFVSYLKIRSLVGDHHSLASENHMKVFISNLRKKLQDNYKIIPVTALGYKLKNLQ